MVYPLSKPHDHSNSVHIGPELKWLLEIGTELAQISLKPDNKVNHLILDTKVWFLDVSGFRMITAVVLSFLCKTRCVIEPENFIFTFVKRPRLFSFELIEPVIESGNELFA